MEKASSQMQFMKPLGVSLGLGCAPNAVTVSCEEERPWRDREASQVAMEAEIKATPRQAWEHPGAQGGAWSSPPLWAPEGTSPAHTWVSDFWPPDLGGNKYLLFQAKCVALCHSSLRTLVRRKGDPNSLTSQTLGGRRRGLAGGLWGRALPRHPLQTQP